MNEPDLEEFAMNYYLYGNDGDEPDKATVEKYKAKLESILLSEEYHRKYCNYNLKAGQGKATGLFWDDENKGCFNDFSKSIIGPPPKIKVKDEKQSRATVKEMLEETTIKGMAQREEFREKVKNFNKSGESNPDEITQLIGEDTPGEGGELTPVRYFPDMQHGGKKALMELDKPPTGLATRTKGSDKRTARELKGPKSRKQPMGISLGGAMSYLGVQTDFLGDMILSGSYGSSNNFSSYEMYNFVGADFGICQTVRYSHKAGL